MTVLKAEHAFSRLTLGGRMFQAEGRTGHGCEGRHWLGDGRSERFVWSWRMNWWEEVTMESLAEAGTIQAQEAVSGTNRQERLTEVPWRIFTAFPTVYDSLLMLSSS